MTRFGLDYLEYQERKRSNLVNEGETHRSNLAKETETNRHNVITERETQRSNLANEAETHRSNTAKEYETHRSNVAKESETKRSNLAKEAETHRANVAGEKNKRYEISMKHAPKTVSQVAASLKLGEELNIDPATLTSNIETLLKSKGAVVKGVHNYLDPTGVWTGRNGKFTQNNYWDMNNRERMKWMLSEAERMGLGDYKIIF